MWEQRFIQSIVVQFDYFRFFRWEIIGGQAWRERVFRVRAVCFYQVSSNSWRVVVSGQYRFGKRGGLFFFAVFWQSFNGNVSLEDIFGVRDFFKVGCSGGQELVVYLFFFGRRLFCLFCVILVNQLVEFVVSKERVLGILFLGNS